MLSTTVIELNKIYEHLESKWPYEWAIKDHAHAVFICGSFGWGTNNDESDLDVMIVVIPPAEYVLGLNVFDAWHHQDEMIDARVYSLKKFVTHLTKCNPNAVELLFLGDHRHHHTVFTNFLFKGRDKFLVKQTVNTLLQAATGRSPLNPEGKARKDLVEKYGYDVKSAAHSLRWLILAKDLLNEDTPSSTLSKNKIVLLNRVARGEYSMDDYATYFNSLSASIKQDLELSGWDKSVDKDYFERGLVESMRIFM